MRPAEKRPRFHPMIVPAVVLALLVGAVGYYLSLSYQERRLLAQLRDIQTQLKERRAALRSVEELDAYRGSPLLLGVNQWAPVFADPVEARLRTEGRVLQALKEAGARAPTVQWEESKGASGVRQARLSVKAGFPSYGSLLRWLREMEEGAPPMLPRSLEIAKQGTQVRLLVTLSAFFRVEHDAL